MGAGPLVPTSNVTVKLVSDEGKKTQIIIPQNAKWADIMKKVDVAIEATGGDSEVILIDKNHNRVKHATKREMVSSSKIELHAIKVGLYTYMLFVY